MMAITTRRFGSSRKSDLSISIRNFRYGSLAEVAVAA